VEVRGADEERRLREGRGEHRAVDRDPAAARARALDHLEAAILGR
jgi:hypothetical protein